MQKSDMFVIFQSLNTSFRTILFLKVKYLCKIKWLQKAKGWLLWTWGAKDIAKTLLRYLYALELGSRFVRRLTKRNLYAPKRSIYKLQIQQSKGQEISRILEELMLALVTYLLGSDFFSFRTTFDEGIEFVASFSIFVSSSGQSNSNSSGDVSNTVAPEVFV